MANIKSQIKRNRQNDAAHERNKAVKSALKTAVRKFREAAESGNADEAKAAAADAGQAARQGRLQGRHPQEPGREPQVVDPASRPPRSEAALAHRRQAPYPSGAAPSCCPGSGLGVARPGAHDVEDHLLQRVRRVAGLALDVGVGARHHPDRAAHAVGVPAVGLAGAASRASSRAPRPRASGRRCASPAAADMNLARLRRPPAMALVTSTGAVPRSSAQRSSSSALAVWP